MKLRLVAHASLLIEAGGATIWTDPWLGGKVFNNLGRWWRRRRGTRRGSNRSITCGSRTSTPTTSTCRRCATCRRRSSGA
ncbi:hypothetical protein [Nannocystis pusilla]|uniref:hypothetical protein n=1 Tax=Nannocystis pusilla TaxID=889268 RepID=UPI003B78B558